MNISNLNISVPPDVYDYLVECRHTVRILDRLSKADRYIPDEIKLILQETVSHDPDGDLPFVTVGNDDKEAEAYHD